MTRVGVWTSKHTLDTQDTQDTQYTHKYPIETDNKHKAINKS
jgi:hypothetical protein